MEEFKNGPEALAWLRSNLNKHSGFASNRFTMEQAIEFVEALYAGGSTKVMIPEDSIREEESDPGVTTPYSDSMVVFYEPNVPTNEAMVRMCLQEIEDEGLLQKESEYGELTEISVDEALPESMAGNSIFLWWD